MKVSIEDRSSTEKKIDVVIPADTVRLEREGIVRKISRNAKVDGFRKGKVPGAEIRKLFANEIKEELVSNLITNSFSDALKEVSVSPVSRPAITPGDIEGGGDFSYSAVFDVLPEFEIPVYKGLELTQNPISVSGKDVESAIEKIAEGEAKVEPCEQDNACAAGDVAEVDYRGTLDGKTIEGLEKSGVRFLLGKGHLIEQFEKNIIGMKSGEEKEFEVSYPEDFQIREAAGKSVKFNLKVKQVFNRKVPQVDDGFAKKHGSKDLADFKINIEKELKARLEAVRDMSLDEQICSKLGEAAKFEVPARLVSEERRRLEAEMKKDFENRGMKVPPVDDKASESLNRRAGENVKLSLLISKIAEAESIEASSGDLERRFSSIASQSGVAPEQVREYYGKKGLMNSLNSQIVSAKVMEFIRKNSKVKTEEPPPASAKKTD